MANQLNKAHEDVEVRIFLIADAGSCAISWQITPIGYYTFVRLMKVSINKGSKVKICSSRAEASGLKNTPLIEETEISTMDELTQWVVDSDKVITF